MSNSLTAERNLWRKNDYNIERVEFYYNGDEEKFDRFLSSAIKEYISTDKTAADCENSKSA